MRQLRNLLLALCVLPGFAWAIPDFVTHVPAASVYGEPGGTTMRSSTVPREDEAVSLWVKIGYSFYYTDVAIYYTVDGSTPAGSFGSGFSGTQVLRSSSGQIQFVRNEPSGSGNIDWWKTTLPASTRAYGSTIRYIVSAWHSGGGPEIFANNTGCSDGVCDDPSAPATLFSYTNKLAWPGRGAPYVDHASGYPPVYFWKEEAVVGNHYTNVMLDQNGTVFDMYYPSAGMVQGMGTKNEGYVDGPDTFPPGLPLDHRGQMNLNQAMPGLRVDGKTYWFSNESASGYSQVAQAYLPTSNTVQTSARLTAAGNNILVQQIDFAPRGITFPNDLGGNPNRGIYVKRVLLTNQGASSKTVNFYYYGDFALNGGDIYDAMYTDPGRGAMIAYDNIPRLTGSSGEYNPTSFSNYFKDVSIYLAAALKVCSSVGSSAGTIATDFWRDTSGDNGQGWIGVKVVLDPGVTREIDVVLAGGFDGFGGAAGTYDYQIAPALDWFASTSMQTVQATTDASWAAWLDSGTTIDTPEQRYDDLFTRSLLATALHLDGKNGGVIAGMHNGAYPCVWPRDAAYAAVTLARTGHFAESAEVYRFLRDVAYRASESWGKAFWYQKYTTDGYIVWNAPQVDETSCVPWGVYFHYLMTGDGSFLATNWPMVREAALASSSDSTVDTRLYYDESVQLMHTNNVWEDAWGHFIYSNASVERGLRDAAAIAGTLGHVADAGDFQGRAAQIHSGLMARLTWDGENSDISLLGIVYPFKVFTPTESRTVQVLNRINGLAADRFGNVRSLVQGSGEFQGLIDRYWGDTYWNGGPWFLSTMWYGLHYAERADFTPGKADINVLKSKLDLLFPHLGRVGLGAEQIAPSNSLLYPGQPDFRLQAAWPNAWESMSTYVDSLMAFLDMTPDAPNNILRLAPKLPTGWSTLTYKNVRLGASRLDIKVTETGRETTVEFTNLSGGPLQTSTWLRLPTGAVPTGVVTVNGAKTTYQYDGTANRVRVQTPIATGTGAKTTIRVLGKAAISPP
jgi:GH15 family glucan-1,4-alpha-glucosidase